MAQTGVTGINPDTVQSFLKSMSNDSIDAFVGAGHSVYSCTVGAGDAILIPFDWMFAEQVQSDEDIHGTRFCFWLKSDMEAMETTSRWLLTAKRPNGFLTNALDVIVAGSAGLA